MYSKIKSLYKNFDIDNSKPCPTNLFTIHYEENWPNNNTFPNGYIPQKWGSNQKFYWTKQCFGVPTQGGLIESTCPYGTGEYKNPVGFASSKGNNITRNNYTFTSGYNNLDNQTDTSLANQYGIDAQLHFGNDCPYGYKLLCPYQENSIKQQYAPYNKHFKFQLRDNF